MFRRVVLLFVITVFSLLTAPLSAEERLQFGFAKADITPTQPLRLSGYGNRVEPSEGVDEPLWVRAMALRSGNEGPLHVIVSAETIGVPGTMSKDIHQRIAKQHELPRANFVLCCTHTHTAPHIAVGLTNLFSTPLTDEQRQDLEEYAQRLIDQVIAAVDAAVADLQPGRMFIGEGEATFADNRRVLTKGIWSGFGVNPDGPVDHSLPIIKVTDESGETIRGLVFNYACHCTTFDSNYNRVNGDWAGYAAQYLEQNHPDATALCTIGCGADANPERDRSRDLQLAKAQAGEIVDSVAHVIEQPMTEVTSAPQASFGYAGLPIDRPSRQFLEDSLKDNSPQVRRHAEDMLAIQKRMGRLPESYPMPIQAFRFGNQFGMVFLGGEVVVDYALRIKREFAEDFDLPVWVTAYANDVFGYVASERMRSEGGYEVDFSMIYYNQPGRWSTGTEDLVLRRVHDIIERAGAVSPVSPEESLNRLTLPNGYSASLVAAEPLIRDPVNFAIAADGRLWVVEMGDYPSGDPDAPRSGDREGKRLWEGPPGGAVKVLTDTNGDGRYDEAVTFLDELTFPTGVFPWRDGVVISSAPEIFFARDTDGDGRADERRVLFSGLHEGNPQHRVNGFAYGLDGWLYLADTSSSRVIKSAVTGDQIDTSGRDLRINPDQGTAIPVSGPSQYGRCRDDWGNWFGNNNSEPLYHFAIEDRYLQRNPYVPSPSPRVFLTDPATAPPVYPTSLTEDRFNDLFTFNRFTSACAPQIVRDGGLSEDLNGAALVCEPVHNLVSRVMLEPDGVTFNGHRHPDETESEFFSSRDNWFRPVHVETGPDQSIWVCDMYRQVIEHPQWIPEAWQAKLDLYAGHERGRIYRIHPDGQPVTGTPNLADLSTDDLVRELASENSWRRDTAQRLLIERADAAVVPALERLAQTHARPEVRVQSIATLSGLKRLSPSVLTSLLSDAAPHIVEVAIRFSEIQLSDPAIISQLLSLVEHDDLRVRYQLALSLGESDDPRIATALQTLATNDGDDPWMRAAVLSSAGPHAQKLLTELLADRDSLTRHASLLQDLIATALGDDVSQGLSGIVSAIAGEQTRHGVEDWQIAALGSCVEAVRRRGKDWSEATTTATNGGRTAAESAEPIFAAARNLAVDDEAAPNRRILAVRLLGVDGTTHEDDLAALKTLISPRVAPELQVAAIEALAAADADDLTDVLLNEWSQHTPAVRTEVLSTLLSRRRWTSEFVTALEAGKVPVQDIDASTRVQLQLHLRDTGRESANRIFDEVRSSDRAEVIASYQNVHQLKGHADQGALLFKKTCGTCHKHGGIGNELGPQLANLKNKSTDALLTALLDPNRAVEQKFRGYVVLTSDGRVVSGLVKSETASSITIVEPNGKEHVILRIDIDEMKDTGKSFMPEGLEKDLTPQNIADIIAFVTSVQ